MRVEDQEQMNLFEWAKIIENTHPEVRLLYHIPNEGKRAAYQGARLKAMGLKAGVPDLCLPVARGGYHALYIELKAPKNSYLSNHQRVWLDNLKAAGNYACCCHGWEEAADMIDWYLSQSDIDYYGGKWK